MEAESEGKNEILENMSSREIPETSCHWKEDSSLPVRFSNGRFTQIDLGEGDVILHFFQFILACRMQMVICQSSYFWNRDIAKQLAFDLSFSPQELAFQSTYL